jgi:hypothetical protein
MFQESLALFNTVRAASRSCHSIGLSIGSAGLFDTAHVEQIVTCTVCSSSWHSDLSLRGCP